MNTIVKWAEQFDSLVWGIPMLILLIGTGVFMTIQLRFFQFRRFGTIMKHTVGRLFEKRKNQDGSLTSMQALTTALAGTVGTGNIAGVAGALALGGPGAIFWMWIAALFGMCTKYSEILLAVHFRKTNKKGEFVGGPMYYIYEGLGYRWKPLATVFCIFGAIAAIGTGNMTQINTIATSIGSVVSAFDPAISSRDLQGIYMVIGIIGCILTVLVLFGGMQRIGMVTEKLVPIMAMVYVISAIVVVASHANVLGATIALIFHSAFNPEAVGGGLAGVAMQQVVKAGFGRGIFSNEAGLGTAPIAHAAADVEHPVEQGMYGIFEVFADTIIICTLTALAILVSGAAEGFYGGSAGTDLTILAFSSTFGSKVASTMIAVCIAMFAFSTLLSWSLYGSRCAEFIFGETGGRVYQAIYVAFVIVGANVKLGLVWTIADATNALMAIPNLVALLILSPIVVKLTREYFAH